MSASVHATSDFARLSSVQCSVVLSCQLRPLFYGPKDGRPILLKKKRAVGPNVKQNSALSFEPELESSFYFSRGDRNGMGFGLLVYTI